MKKIEIIARITEDNGATTENPLMIWENDGDHKGYPFLSSTLTYPGLKFDFTSDGYYAMEKM